LQIGECSDHVSLFGAPAQYSDRVGLLELSRHLSVRLQSRDVHSMCVWRDVKCNLNLAKRIFHLTRYGIRIC
jgi:hypothetical protein